MIPLFLGLTVANVTLLAAVFIMGLSAIDIEGGATAWYAYHVAAGIATGLVAVLTHVVVYTYFMATTKWLAAATDKVGLDEQRFVRPAQRRKSRQFAVMMAVVGVTMLTMFAGAGADSTLSPLWPAQVHLVLAMIAIAANVLAALVEYQLINAQGALMDHALAQVNQPRTHEPLQEAGR